MSSSSSSSREDTETQSKPMEKKEEEKGSPNDDKKSLESVGDDPMDVDGETVESTGENPQDAEPVVPPPPKPKPTLKLLPYNEKCAFLRKKRRIETRKAHMPTIVCPVIGMVSPQEAELLNNDAENIIYTERYGERIKVAAMSNIFTEDQFVVDADLDDDDRALEVERKLHESNIDALICGPMPLSWMIPDREYKPRSSTLQLFPGSTYHSYFKMWGQLSNDCPLTMAFHPNKTISLLICYKSPNALAQAALNLFGHRYFEHQKEVYPVHLDFVNFRKKKEEFVNQQSSFEELTRGLSMLQKKAFSDVMANMDRLQRENEELIKQVGGLQERKKARLEAQKAALLAKMRLPAASTATAARPRDNSAEITEKTEEKEGDREIEDMLTGPDGKLLF